MEMKFAVSRIALPSRLVLFAGCSAAGLLIQSLLSGGLGFFAGILLMVPGIVFLWAKNYRNSGSPSRCGSSTGSRATSR